MIPNATIVFKGKELIVRCIGNQDGQNEQENWKFESIRISYTNLIDKTSKRKQDLQEQYYFECTCIRCSSDKENNSDGKGPNTTFHQMELAKESSLMCHNCSNCVILGSSSGKIKCHRTQVPRLRNIFSLHSKFLMRCAICIYFLCRFYL